jgi:Spy/CpxP family protein refolding chaperone
MKRIFLIFALALLATGAYAQGGEPGPQHEGMGHMHRMSAAERTQHLTKELGLSKDQAAKVQQIFEAQQKKHEAEMQAGGDNLTPEQRRQQFVAARKDVDAQIEAVLTDAQKQKFSQMRDRMKQHRGPNGDQPPPPDQQ